MKIGNRGSLGVGENRLLWETWDIGGEPKLRASRAKRGGRTNWFTCQDDVQTEFQ